tara:strand:+ start:1004 stop:1198 length:195 start_codon:yes stop_codon:yes gene_type:complete
MGTSIKGDKYKFKKNVEDLIIQLNRKIFIKKSLYTNKTKEEEKKKKQLPFLKKDSKPKKILFDI